MSLELRPTWTWADSDVEGALQLGDWITSDRRRAFDLDGDSWRPGQAIDIVRRVDPSENFGNLTSDVQLGTGIRVGVAARWSCRAAALAGVHDGGPLPAAVGEGAELRLSIPASVAESVEIETCIVAWAEPGSSSTKAPGALLWSDGWSIVPSARTITLEGSEARIPVRTLSFSEHFGGSEGALWSIELGSSIELDDQIGNSCSVLLNESVLTREFQGSDGTIDASLLPPIVLTGIQVDLLRSLTAVLKDELSSNEFEGDEPAPGTVGAMLIGRLTETFGSVDAGIALLEEDRTTFDRDAWSRFAPNQWGAKQ